MDRWSDEEAFVDWCIPSHLSHQNTKQVALQFRQGGGVTAPVPQRVCALLRASLAGVEQQVGTTVLVSKSLCLNVCSHPSTMFPVCPIFQIGGEAAADEEAAGASLRVYREEVQLTVRRIEAAVAGDGGGDSLAVGYCCWVSYEWHWSNRFSSNYPSQNSLNASTNIRPCCSTTPRPSRPCSTTARTPPPTAHVGATTHPFHTISAHYDTT